MHLASRTDSFPSARTVSIKAALSLNGTPMSNSKQAAVNRTLLRKQSFKMWQEENKKNELRELTGQAASKDPPII